VSKLFDELVKKRGLSESFLHPNYEECFDPFLLPDLDKATERIKQAVASDETVLIYGDYDVDGVTATTIMHDALKLAGITEIITMLPDRFLDGYGMNKKIVQRAKAENVGLVVTVDCGSANDEIVTELAENGVDTIVTDHHECPLQLPSRAVAVVNPKRKDIELKEPSLRDLSGAGVAFELARGLTKQGLIPEGQEKWFLDLALIGTLCDSMEMTAENRRICFFGMKVLAKTRRLGLKELMRVAGVKRLSADAVGFQLGPRLNAAGRMSSPEKALKLLMTTSKTEAAELAAELDRLNIARKTQQKQAVKDICDKGIMDKNVIVACGSWHEGILGIIAGKLTEKYQKPAFVLTEINGELKGSGRSFGDFSLVESLGACADVISSGGGHAAACGLKLEKDKLESFREKVNEYYESLNLKNQERFLDKREDLTVNALEDISLEFLEEISLLEPFGRGNEEPILKLEDMRLVDARRMGAHDEHISLRLQGKTDEQLKTVAFYAPEEWLKSCRGQKGDIWVVAMLNEWNGTQNVEGRIVKIRLVEDDIF